MNLRLPQLFIILALFSVVLVSPNTIFPFIVAKAYWFRLCVSLALISLVIWIGFRAGKQELSQLFYLLRSPLFLTVTIFVATFILASVFAHDPYSAFWSNFERSEGGFQMIYYYLFFVIVYILISKEKEFGRFLAWSVVASALLVIAYGVLAALGLSLNNQTLFIGPLGLDGWLKERFWGSLGNAAYTGSFLLFALWWTFWLWVSTKNLWLKRLLVMIALIIIPFFLLTQTRGAFLGIIAGVMAFLIFLFVNARNFRKTIVSLFLIIFFVVSGLIVFKDSAAVSNLPVLGRLVRVSVFDKSVQDRFWVWRAAFDGWANRPILGWGPENFTDVFSKRFDPRYFVPGQTSVTWYDRAHNVFFDYLVETGLLGLLSYLGIFAVFYRKFFRFIKPPTLAPSGVLEGGLLFIFPVMYLVQGMAIFDTLPIYLNLFLFLALAASRFKPERHV